jgi:hypothetical protein
VLMLSMQHHISLSLVQTKLCCSDAAYLSSVRLAVRDSDCMAGTKPSEH